MSGPGREPAFTVGAVENGVADSGQAYRALAASALRALRSDRILQPRRAPKRIVDESERAGFGTHRRSSCRDYSRNDLELPAQQLPNLSGPVSHRRTSSQGLVWFYLECGLGALVNIGIASHLFGGGGKWWLAGIAGVAGSVWNYALSSMVTWKRA